MTVQTVSGTQDPGFWSKAGTAFKDAAIWIGRVVKSFFNNYLVPAVKAIWEFLKTPFGWSTMAFAAGITFISIAAAKEKTQDTLAARIAFYTAAILCFMGAGAALTIGCLGAAKSPLLPQPA